MPGSVLDSFALITYFRDEAGADKVEALLHNAAIRHEPLHMTEVNYAEVQIHHYSQEWNDGMGIGRCPPCLAANYVHPVTRELADTAARLKAAHRISLADAFAAALAKHCKCELVTGDREFKAVENDLKKIRWLK